MNVGDSLSPVVDQLARPGRSQSLLLLSRTFVDFSYQKFVLGFLFFFFFVFPSFYAERETPTTRVKGVILENGTHTNRWHRMASSTEKIRFVSASTLRLSRRPRFIFPVGSRRRLCCVYLSLVRQTHTLGMVGGGRSMYRGGRLRHELRTYGNANGSKLTTGRKSEIEAGMPR